MKENFREIESLMATIRELRGPQGCPWDAKQTVESLSKYLREEMEELLHAIEKRDTQNICEEIGDVTFVLMMISEICKEQGFFSYSDSLTQINEKLVRRHPHVFGDAHIENEDQLRKQWEKIKQMEKDKKN